MEFLNKKYTNDSVLSQMEESDYDKYSSWLSKFTDACQCDKWGQVVEATEAYQDIERTFTLRCEEGGAALWGRLSVRERENSRKLAMLIKLRIATMEQTHIEGPGIDDMDLLLDRFCAILSGLVIFPIPVEDYELDSNEVDRIARFESMTPIKKEIEVGNEVPGEGGIGGDKSSPNGRSSVGGVGGGGGVSSPQSQGRHVYAQSQTPLEERVKSSKYVYAATAVTNGGALKEPKEPTADSSYFSIEIEKIGLKDASTFGYIDPYLIITVADARGCIIDQQQTPPGRQIEGNYIHFDDIVVHLETPINQLEEGNCGVFFEVMHYKSKKGKNSCRCWGFMEPDEIVGGGTSLELYKKPADFLRRKKNIHLFSVKDLFLCIRGFVRKHDE